MKIIFKVPNYNSIKINYVIPFLMFANCGFYFFKFPVLAPVYIFFYIATIFYIISTAITLKIPKIPISSILALCFCGYILVVQPIVGGKSVAIIGGITPVIFYILGTAIFQKLSSKDVLRISNAMLFVSFLIYTLDTLYRLSLFKFNLIYLLTGLNFYQMKISTLLYSDTNTIGINTVVLVFFSFYLYLITKHKNYIFYIIIFLILNFFSFSRAAIIAEILTIILLAVLYSFKVLLKTSKKINLYVISIKKVISFLFLSILICIGVFILTKVFVYISTDPSFGTKIELFNTLKTFLQKASFDDLFLGIGYNNGRLFEFGSERRYAHTYLLTYICETGILGYLIITSFLLTVLFETPKNIIILFPFVIIGISLISHTQLHVFYTVLALIWYFEHFVKYENNFLCLLDELKHKKWRLIYK